ncbi:MAG: hypothetical protein [Caudoviricetes sp.]|nr:MAG: hypothetical protein [Caudoviricetes sp.]
MKIIGYEAYTITEEGIVIGARGSALKPDKNSTGYLRVSLSKGGVVSRQFVHRLVAIHFVDGYEEDKVVNHKDGNNQNNHKNNLEWVTPSENVIDGWKRGRDSSHLHLNFRKGL